MVNCPSCAHSGAVYIQSFASLWSGFVRGGPPARCALWEVVAHSTAIEGRRASGLRPADLK
jgi:hypothetical protein